MRGVAKTHQTAVALRWASAAINRGSDHPTTRLPPDLPAAWGVIPVKDDFSKYETMRDAGASAEDVYLEAARDGLDNITQIRLIRAVYSLSLGEAKDVFVRAEGLAGSRDEFQGMIADSLSGAPSPR